MRISPVIALCLGLSLACGGAGSQGSDDSLQTWNLEPGSDQPSVRLELILDDRVAIYVDGAHSGELDIPTLPEASRSRPGMVLSELDIDFDGFTDLQVRDSDQSSAYNLAYAWYRYDPSSQSYLRCSALDGLHNIGTDPGSQRLYSTTLGNGVGASGTTTWFEASGGCSFVELGTMSWDIAMSNGRGDAKCTLVGEVEPVWRMQVNQRPDRACPE